MSHYGRSAATYRVVISASGLGGAAPADGFIDNTKVSNYVANGSSEPTTSAQALAKERANVRFDTMIQSVQASFNFASTVTKTGGDATTAPTAIQLDIVIEHGAEAASTPDENNAGVMLTGIDAIKRHFARALLIERTKRCEYVDPTASSTAATGQDNASSSAARRGDTIADVVVGKLTSSLATAESKITVTAL